MKMTKPTFIKVALIMAGCLVLGRVAYWETMYMGDYSPYLTRMAKTGTPLVTQAVAFYREHGRAPTDDELRELVHDPRVGHGPLSNSIISGQYPQSRPWWYIPQDGSGNPVKGFTMYCIIWAHFSALNYTFDGTTGKWRVVTENQSGPEDPGAWDVRLTP
jgi:hypothetical protein